MLDAIGRITTYDFSGSDEVKLISKDGYVPVGKHHEHALEVVAVQHLDMKQGQLVLNPKVYLCSLLRLPSARTFKREWFAGDHLRWVGTYD